MAKPYDTGAGVYFWGPYDGWMQEQCPIKPNVEHKNGSGEKQEEEEKGNPPFEYHGQEVTLAFVSEIVNLLKGNKISLHVINDAMWRFYGCQNRINSIDLVIPAAYLEDAVKVLRAAKFDDDHPRCIGDLEVTMKETNEHDRSGEWRSRETHFIGAPCPYLWNLRARWLDAWWVPDHVFHLQPAPGQERHVDLNLFCHEEYFFHLPLPGSRGSYYEKAQMPIYLDSTDVALEREVEEPYAVTMLFPARMVEALVRLSFQDRYLYSHLSRSLSEGHGWTEWDRTLRDIFCSITGRTGEEEARRQVRAPGPQLMVNKTLVEVDDDHLEEAVLTLKGLKPHWFRLKDFHPLFQDYLQALFLARENGGPCKPSPPQQEQGQDQEQPSPYPREWLEHCPIRENFQHCTAFPVLNDFAWRFKEAGFFPKASPFYREKTTRAIKALNHPQPPISPGRGFCAASRMVAAWRTPVGRMAEACKAACANRSLVPTLLSLALVGSQAPSLP
ncbi:uncharacterized protein BO95DRAFT_500879 [Aspergillus brunneoviolaceus CBS 621.78]|uniref:Uncharacterized protein n=1 Tax=Aspergillus brunneoviolaceus CBS 621.78 TaxID=1450534 RepID=A0ACD1GMD2_9EURO|nr:hypothetical protein BO95DRAFT_500879 [Aspergillus brunneoviolaceus CBS 621.78]RAH50397.1 hypothetical protein BO95DRAFT_500879 [Aspergillus brunneoviolaceus CBS 621.78]